MNQNKETGQSIKKIGETVRQACIEAAKEGFTDARMNGLCDEGAVEAAISAIQNLDIETLLQEQGR